MRLTAYTDYTLRTLIYLAVRPQRGATIAEIATAYGISEAHLTKIIHQLGLAGDVVTTRGRGGGLRLGKPAEMIGAIYAWLQTCFAFFQNGKRRLGTH